MTQIGENVFVAFVQKDKSDNKCSHEDDKTDWKCNLEGETSGHLVDNIVRDSYGDEPQWPPIAGKANIDNCSSSTWPHQAHHLIPWQQLKKHKTSHLLSKIKNHLTYNNNYSVNHGTNGYFMPYVTDLEEWSLCKGKEKQLLAEKLMNITGIQLHQSRHSRTRYECAKEGYKVAVDTYLNKVHKESLRHYDVCSKCKDEMNKNKWPPRKAVVRYVDKVSRILLSDIKANRIFVSRRAAIWACRNQAK